MSSKRKGQAHKANRKTIKIDDDTHEKLVNASKSKKIGMKEIIGTLVDMNERFNFLREGWLDRIKEAEDKSDFNRYQSLDEGDCPALAFTNKDGFVCCIKAPSHKKLGDGKIQDRDAICAACVRVKGIITENELFKRQVREGTLIEIPACKEGANINEEGTELYCPHAGKWNTIEMCKRYDYQGKRSGRCAYLSTSKIRVKGILKEDGPR